MPSRLVAIRWLIARKSLAPALQAAGEELLRGDYRIALQAVADFWSQLGIREEPAEIGYRKIIETEWFYALGPRDKERFRKIVRQTDELLKRLAISSRGPGDSSQAQRLHDMIGELAKEAAWLEKIIQKASSDFQHGDFRIVPMHGVPKTALDECLGALDEAARHVRKKFPQLLYGKVYISKSVGHTQVANYVQGQDTIQLSVRASTTVGSVHAICHELGHRYYHVFFHDKALRDEFWRLSTQPEYEVVKFDVPTRLKLADEFLSIVREQREQGRRAAPSDLLSQWLTKRMEEDVSTLRGLVQSALTDPTLDDKLHDAVAWKGGPKVVEVRTGKVLREPLAVTEYGKKSWQENFAEGFAHYVMSKALPPEITSIFERM